VHAKNRAAIIQGVSSHIKKH